MATSAAWSTLSGAVGADHVGEARAVDVLHDDEVRAVLLAPVVDADDVRVVQVGGGLGLAAEARDEGRVGGELGEEDLDRDRPVELEVAGEEHLGHAALAEAAAQLEAAVEHGGFGHRSARTLVGPRSRGSEHGGHHEPARPGPRAGRR